jgi:nucleotide-binding universal stress UspA family protein
MFKHILVPVDGSDCSLYALDMAASFAREQQARLSICTVVDPAKAAAMAFGEAAMSAACMNALDDEGKVLVQDAAARIRATWVADVEVLDGAPVDSIVEYARETSVDLIIVGSHGRSGLSRLVLGSVAEGVIRNAASPVMVVRHVAAHHSAGDKAEVAQAPASA